MFTMPPRPLYRCLVAVLAGGLLPLALAPFNLWPLALFSVAGLAYLLDSLKGRQAFYCGWFYGLGLFGVGVSWVYISIVQYGPTTVLLAGLLTFLLIAYLALLVGLTAYVYARYLRDTPGGRYWAWAALWVLGEWLRSVLLTGFPWLYVGYAYITTPLAGWAPVGGVWAISFVVAMTGAVVAQLAYGRCVRRAMAVVLVLWLSGALLGAVTWVKPADQPVLDVALVQANIAQSDKWDPTQYEAIIARYQQMSAPLWSQVDVVVWPEVAIPALYQQAGDFLQPMASLAQQYDAHLVTGIPYAVTDDHGRLRYYNSMAVLDEREQFYFKQRLVPFGEFTPFAQWLGDVMAVFALPIAGMSPGPVQQPLLKVAGSQWAPLICYEIAYPHHTWSNGWNDQADVLITLSNDAWFGRSLGPWQHLQMAQMRALELGRYVLRATSTGVSAIIDQRGRLLQRSEWFVPQVITGRIVAYQGLTPFARWASWPLLILCGLIIIICVLRSIIQQRVKKHLC